MFAAFSCIQRPPRSKAADEGPQLGPKNHSCCTSLAPCAVRSRASPFRRLGSEKMARHVITKKQVVFSTTSLHLRMDYPNVFFSKEYSSTKWAFLSNNFPRVPSARAGAGIRRSSAWLGPRCWGPPSIHCSACWTPTGSPGTPIRQRKACCCP